MRKKKTVVILIAMYCMSTLLFSIKAIAIRPDKIQLTSMCLQSTIPVLTIEETEDTRTEEKGGTGEKSDIKEVRERVAKSKKKDNGKPRVLIYHTHATESYMPSYQGNYHKVGESDTVREVGDVMEAVLEEKGIGVVHDKTLHDNPSYDMSYSRSYNTARKILKKYPSIECIIDLHRDATAAKTSGPVVMINGKRCATYSFVLSNTTETCDKNRDFLNRLNSIGQTRFSGFTGNILERPYWYNQELCGKAVLIEVGNNRSTITEARRCGEYFGLILAKALKD